jgi:hypothetical protein
MRKIVVFVANVAHAAPISAETLIGDPIGHIVREEAEV